MSIKTSLLRMLIPSLWIEWLKGKKRILGIISLLLWACIYLLPAMLPELGPVATAALTVQQFLLSFGLDLDGTLLNAGAGLTVIGLIDWICKHIVSDGVIWLLEKLQGATKLVAKARAE